MNKERRKKLETLVSQLKDLRDSLEELSNEELEALENIPDSLREGERGVLISQFVDELFSSLDSIDDICSNLRDNVLEV